MRMENFFFKLWKTTFDELVSERTLSEDDVRMAMDSMKKPFRLRDRFSEFMNIDFNDVCNCVAYTKRLAICYSLITEEATRKFFSCSPIEKITSLLSLSCIRVASVGGGPGSDLMGFYHALRKRWHDQDSPASLLWVSGTIYDYFSGWEVIVDKVMDVAGREECSELNENVVFDTNFAQMDFTKAFNDDDVEDLDALREADVVLVVKVLSIMESKKGETFLKNVLSYMKKPESVMIFVDATSHAIELLKKTVSEFANFEVIFGPTNPTILRTDILWNSFVSTSCYQICFVQLKKNNKLVHV